MTYPFLKKSVLPLQLTILREYSHANIQLTHSKMIGTFNIANNIIQIAAKEYFLINDIATSKIIDHTYNNQGRNNQLRLQIAYQDSQKQNNQQKNISIHP